MHNLARLKQAKERFFHGRRTFRKEGPAAEAIQAIANQNPIPRELVRTYLRQGNLRVASFLRDDTEGLRIVRPGSTDVELAIKMCVDSRAMVLTILDHILRIGLERTAGAIVRDGHVFRKLVAGGVGVVTTHEFCGAEGAAHDFHKYRKNIRDVDPDLFRIITGIPKAVAVLDEGKIRSRFNSTAQTNSALAAMAQHCSECDISLSETTNIHPAMTVFEPEAKLVMINPAKPLEDLDVENPIINELKRNVADLHLLAKEEGRSMQSQYAHVVLVYDPDRTHDPRLLFGLLPNEAFVVTVNSGQLFKKAQNKEELIRGSASIGCVKYAVSDGGNGHVKGVGKEGGNGFVLIVDPDPKVATKIKDILLGNGNGGNGLKAATKGGETIEIAQYNPETHLITFVN
ncbi:hypothetical protein HYT84_00145 [Candidatus Micrarchaeota archaeon]|nr:hypothetical protein [Candidatus Micrarchaeota archaeon]